MNFKRSIVHLLLMVLLVAVVVGAVMIWLGSYTNHGQQLKVKDYKGLHVDKAKEDAKSSSFELIVKDSIHKVGQPGGIILAQKPIGGSLVKENRKIYVDVSKYKPDVYDISELPPLYGNAYHRKTKELHALGMNCEIIGYKQDPGAPDYILEVRYDGQLIDGPSGRTSGVKIERGGTLEFVLSKIDGGEVPIPDLVCMQYFEVGFLLEMYNLALAPVKELGVISDKKQAYIIAQDPSFREGSNIKMGKEVRITIGQKQPESCK